MTEIGLQLFRSDELPSLDKGLTLAHLQSSGNTPETKDLLKWSHTETEIRSAHSQIILAEIVSRPGGLKLDNLFKVKLNNTTASRKEIQFLVIYIILL